MPVKRRVAKRRFSPEDELAAWHEVFDVGCDFFGEAAQVAGLRDPSGIVPRDEVEEVQAAWLAATRDAWARLGAAFLATWKPTTHRLAPWALGAFGEPPCR
jgi:hypothetical protein